MYVIEVNGKVWGPFKTADAAAEWAHKELGGIGGGPWSIRPLREPDE